MRSSMREGVLLPLLLLLPPHPGAAHASSEPPPVAVPASAASLERTLLWDYVPWEQMSKQRRGIMWALQTARGLERTLVLPPFRFHTAKEGVYEYVRYSDLFELAPLAALHPVAELADFVATTENRVDLVFSLLKGLPKGAQSAQQRGAEQPVGHWVAGECPNSPSGAPPANPLCEVDEQGEERCTTPMASFAGAEGGVRVRNLTCGWAPDMRWDRILRARDVRGVSSVGVHGIVYQIPPPQAMDALTSYLASERAGKPCEWRCAYAHLRGAMKYRASLIDAAHAFLQQARRRQAAGAVARQRGELSSGSGILADIASGDQPPAAAAAAATSVGMGAGTPSAGAAGAVGELGSGESADSAAAAAAAATAGAAVRVLAVHWRRGDFLSRGGLEHACYDEGTGEQIYEVVGGGSGGSSGGSSGGGGGTTTTDLASAAPVLREKPCTKAAVVLTPQQLATEVRFQLKRHNASLVFLASNAKPEEVAELGAALHGTPLLQFEPSPTGAAWSTAELAVIDTMVCALADAFIGTRRSMFSWNILEERVLQGQLPATGALTGLLNSEGRPKALTKSEAKRIRAQAD